MRRTKRIVGRSVAVFTTAQPVSASIESLKTLPLTYERSHLKSGLSDSAVIIGVDEAGRGPLAGPVVAAACAIIDCSCGEQSL